MPKKSTASGADAVNEQKVFQSTARNKTTPDPDIASGLPRLKPGPTRAYNERGIQISRELKFRLGDSSYQLPGLIHVSLACHMAYAISAANMIQPVGLHKDAAVSRLQNIAKQAQHSILTAAAPTSVLDSPYGAPSERYPPHKGLTCGAQVVWPALVLFHFLLQSPQVSLEVRQPQTLIPISEDGQA